MLTVRTKEKSDDTIRNWVNYIVIGTVAVTLFAFYFVLSSTNIQVGELTQTLEELEFEGMLEHE